MGDGKSVFYNSENADSKDNDDRIRPICMNEAEFKVGDTVAVLSGKGCEIDDFGSFGNRVCDLEQRDWKSCQVVDIDVQKTHPYICYNPMTKGKKLALWEPSSLVKVRNTPLDGLKAGGCPWKYGTTDADNKTL